MRRDCPSLRREPIRRSLNDSFVNSPLISLTKDCSTPVQNVPASSKLNNDISLFGDVSDVDLDIIDSVISSRKVTLPSDVIPSCISPRMTEPMEPQLTDLI